MQPFVIGIPTYKRPMQLKQLLADLSLQLPADVCVVIVDNDPDSSAQSVALEVWHMRVHYLQEPSPGVAQVRTRAMEFSAEMAAGLIFLDDDQTPDPGWYEAFLKAHALDPKAVLAGPVYYNLPAGSPEWARGGYFQRPEHADRALIPSTGFGNCLIPPHVLALPGMRRVDDLFAQSGGEDTEYMWRASRAGVEIRWCSDASTQENVPIERVTPAAVRARLVRNGETMARLRMRESSRIVIAAGGVARILVGLAGLTYTSLTPGGARRTSLVRICSGWGSLRAVVGRSARAYGVW